MAKTLKDVMPPEFLEHRDNRAYKHRDVEVVREFYGHTLRWPGMHRNVQFWVLLKNRRIVGWNENPGRGWSFHNLVCSNDFWKEYGVGA